MDNVSRIASDEDKVAEEAPRQIDEVMPSTAIADQRKTGDARDAGDAAARTKSAVAGGASARAAMKPLDAVNTSAQQAARYKVLWPNYNKYPRVQRCVPNL